MSRIIEETLVDGEATLIEELLAKGEAFLTKEQVSVVNECMTKNVFGLSLNMGFGKTLVSLIVGFKRKIETKSEEPILVVVSKTLIASWVHEITKFFGETLKYQIMDSNDFALKDDTLLVLVTPDTAGKYYTHNELQLHFTKKITIPNPNRRYGFPITVNSYHLPSQPYLTHAVGYSILYKKNWASLIIDEGHKYTNITTPRCQALCAIYTKYRSILSGTLFSEPNIERFMGYHMMLHWPNFPNNIFSANIFMYTNFTGIKQTIIERTHKEILPYKVNRHIIEHTLLPEEGLIYLSMKNTLTILRQKMEKLEIVQDKKKFSTYILAMITYIRQCVVSPILPVANILLELSELGVEKSVLGSTFLEQLKELNIEKFLEDTNSVKSTRIKTVLTSIKKHNKPTDKIVVFSCFRTSLDTLAYFVKNEFPQIDTYTLESKNSVQVRGKTVSDFQSSDKNSILFTTYELGSEGLNLQSANVVIVLDFWWNSATTSQAIARVMRQGQKADTIDIYMYSSCTGIEQALFRKHKDKLAILGELKEGVVKSTVKKLKLNEILRLIESSENKQFLTNTYN